MYKEGVVYSQLTELARCRYSVSAACLLLKIYLLPFLHVGPRAIIYLVTFLHIGHCVIPACLHLIIYLLTFLHIGHRLSAACLLLLIYLLTFLHVGHRVII